MNINSLTIPRPVREDRAVNGGMVEWVDTTRIVHTL